MRLEDYKTEDIEDVIELKGMVLNQLEAIERCLWTDSIDEATARAFHLFEQLRKIRKMKHAKRLENELETVFEKNFGFLMNKLQAEGVHSSVIHFRHKKTD